MDVEILKRKINWNNDKLFLSKAMLVFLNIWLFAQFSPTYEKLWARNKIPDIIPPLLVGKEHSKYKNNTGDFFESASGVQSIDGILQYVKNEKVLGNLYG